MANLLHPLRLRAGLVSVWLLIAVCLFASSARGAALDPLVEYKIKAAYLYNFTKFIEWPPTAFSDQKSSYVIGILEPDTTVSAAMAEVLEGKTTVSGRSIEIRSGRTIEALSDCHIIFVTKNAPPIFPTLPAPRDHPVLLVGETAGFAQSGGTINFLISGDMIRLEINPERAERAGLRLSGTLASIGMLVRDRESKP